MSEPLPLIGRTYECIYPRWTIRMRFLSETQAQVTSNTTGDTELVDISIAQVGDGLYFINWQEADTTVVSSVQDHKAGVVTTCSTHHRGMQCEQGICKEVT